MQAPGNSDQYLHAGQRLWPGAIRPEGDRNLPRQGLFHHSLQPRPISSDGLHEPQNAHDPLAAARRWKRARRMRYGGRMHPFTDFDTAVRLALYGEFVRTASPPTAESIAAYLQVPAADVRAALERLAAGKAIVLQPESREILMANPLCAVPTP